MGQCKRSCKKSSVVTDPIRIKLFAAEIARDTIELNLDEFEFEKKAV
jgi:hypothetical protein